MAVIKCKSCGNEVTLPENVVQGYCTYCGGQVAHETPAAKPEDKVEVNTQLRRAQLLVESGDFISAMQHCDLILNQYPENCKAYFCRMMAELGVNDEKLLFNVDLSRSRSFAMAQRFADEELKAKFAAIERINLLHRHLKCEKSLQKRLDVIAALEKAIALENGLLTCREVLTGEMVQETESFTMQTMADAGDLEEKEFEIRRKSRKKTTIVLSIIAAVFTVIISIVAVVVVVENRNLASGDVCKIKDGVVVGVRYNKEKITKVVIPEYVTEIASGTFSGCSNLKEIIVPEKCKIADNDFPKECIVIKLPAELVTKIRQGDAPAILDELRSALQEIEFSDDCKTVTGVKNKNITKVAIPYGVTEIGYRAFIDCSSLTSVMIPDSVTEIGQEAFSGCSSLTSVTIPDSVTEIGAMAFIGCSSLTSVTIPNSVKTISIGAFAVCSSLTSVTIGNSVTEIKLKAFSGCSSLTSVTIPDSVTEIGRSAFDGCTSLKEVRVPDRCYVGNYAFPDGCRVIRY